MKGDRCNLTAGQELVLEGFETGYLKAINDVLRCLNQDRDIVNLIFQLREMNAHAKYIAAETMIPMFKKVKSR